MSDLREGIKVAQQMEQWARDFSTDEDHDVFLGWAQAVHRLEAQLASTSRELADAKSNIAYLSDAAETAFRDRDYYSVQLASARKALEPFAEIAKELTPQLPNDHKNTMHWAVPTVGDFRRALSTLINATEV